MEITIIKIFILYLDIVKFVKWKEFFCRTDNSFDWTLKWSRCF